VSVEPQLDVPLDISSVRIDSTQPDYLRPDFVVVSVSAVLTNISHATIDALAVSHGTRGETGKSGVMFANILSLDQVLQPGQSKTLTLVTKPQQELALGLTLAVDFVEFTDGTTWGADKFNSAEQLAGQRAGAATEKATLFKLLKERGLTDVVNRLTTDSPNIFTPSGHTAQWEDGFRMGSAILRNRLHHAHEKGGAPQLEVELQQPYDALQGRKKQ